MLAHRWPADEELATALVGALQPLAPWLGCICLIDAPMSPGLIAALGLVLGRHTHTLILAVHENLSQVRLMLLSIHDANHKT